MGIKNVGLPKPGEVCIGFSTQKGILSWSIRKMTGSPASHSFLLFFSAQFGQHMVLEVQGRGFVQVPWLVWLKKNILLGLYQVDRSKEELETAMQSLGRRLGDPYDTFSLVGFLLIYGIRLWDRNDLNDKKKLVCSEMVALFLRWANIPLQTHIDRVIPRDLWRLAEESDDFIIRFHSQRSDKKKKKACKKGHVLLDASAIKAGDTSASSPEGL